MWGNHHVGILFLNGAGFWGRSPSTNNLGLFLSSRYRSMVCWEVLNFRAMALMLIPALIRAFTIGYCPSSSIEGRPKRFPAAFACEIAQCVRSTSKSLSNYATAEWVISVDAFSNASFWREVVSVYQWR